MQSSSPTHTIGREKLKSPRRNAVGVQIHLDPYGPPENPACIHPDSKEKISFLFFTLLSFHFFLPFSSSSSFFLFFFSFSSISSSLFSNLFELSKSDLCLVPNPIIF